jgi:hypothetical protein
LTYPTSIDSTTILVEHTVECSQDRVLIGHPVECLRDNDRSELSEIARRLSQIIRTPNDERQGRDARLGRTSTPLLDHRLFWVHYDHLSDIRR